MPSRPALTHLSNPVVCQLHPLLRWLLLQPRQTMQQLRTILAVALLLLQLPAAVQQQPAQQLLLGPPIELTKAPHQLTQQAGRHEAAERDSCMLLVHSTAR